MRKPKLWIYEYKDDETPTGATLINKLVEEIDDEDIRLPHLNGEWHWRVSITYVEDGDEE